MSNKDEVKPVDYAKLREEFDLAIKLMAARIPDAESFLISFHVVKKGRIFHYFDYFSWKNDDFGKCMIAMGVEARRAELSTMSGGSKVSG